MNVYSFVAWQQTTYSSMRPPGADRIEKAVSLLFLPVFVFTKLLYGKALRKHVTIFILKDTKKFYIFFF
jgi:hypothetical protein